MSRTCMAGACRFFRALMLVIIAGYRCSISPLLPPRCRFQPTCSEYGFQAIEQYGFWRGVGLLLARLVKCHPWGKSGYDPVPPKINNDE